jgi:hypothetical protein
MAATVNNPAGYSGTPLIKKLGIKEGMTLAILGTPKGYLEETLGPLPDGCTLLVKTEPGRLDFLHGFVTWKAELERDFPAWMISIQKNGMIWISWPKKAAKVPTDLDENVIREMGLGIGLVDVKVCAVDEKWSGLKFVYRVKDR